MLKIVKDNLPSLRAKSKEVDLPLDEKTLATIKEMMEYLKLTQDDEFRSSHPSIREGIGLAAPQIGKNLRMLVIYYPRGEGQFVEHALVNPKIVSRSLKKCYLESGEGCLSVEETHEGYAYRAYRIQVKAYDALKGEDVIIKAQGFDAIVLQHEIDHLDGILFYDRIDKKNPFKKEVGAVSI